MSHTSYDVRIYKTDIYVSRKKGGKNTYWVRWKVAGQLFKEPFKGSTLAESFRSQLIAAASKGEAFRVGDGLPVSVARQDNEMSWYDLACRYVDMKWKRAAATSRRSTAEALVTATFPMISNVRGKPSDKLMRSALFRWGFNTRRRNSEDVPEDVSSTLKWIADNTRPVRVLSDPDGLRPVMEAIASKLNGEPAAATVINRKRAVLYNLLEFAVEKKQLAVNPLPLLKWTAPKASGEIDSEAVVNPTQARTLLQAVREVKRSGERLFACYACSYYAALRPEEAVNLRRANVIIPDLVLNPKTGKMEPPEDDWGEFRLRRSAPHAGKEWTNNGNSRDERGLKHRPDGAVRRVPIPPALTKILREHLDRFPPDEERRLFYGERGGEIAVITYSRVWHRARAATFTEDVLASPLAATPYTLRHAAVSTWLNGGVPATQVAAWAGHSVDVLLKVYAKCLDGQDLAARQRMADAVG